MYSFEDEQQVDVSIKYIYDGVNNQWNTNTIIK
jgi:hypothetical protein